MDGGDRNDRDTQLCVRDTSSTLPQNPGLGPKHRDGLGQEIGGRGLQEGTGRGLFARDQLGLSLLWLL